MEGQRPTLQAHTKPISVLTLLFLLSQTVQVCSFFPHWLFHQWAFSANLALGFAPGMGSNAYFVYTVVDFNGSGTISYQNGLAAVFINFSSKVRSNRHSNKFAE
ncbi:hypothetical protein TSUD_319380 [Trifolium subterraneum]|uniref:Uncharacterized protein n=1 Tax=Trifolium subterraneum TaxID=3900 RepID=A0A2Z6LXY3_TRISU|nr:hypothetical protein TSUD_319380 [Trifolium subterraneum]